MPERSIETDGAQICTEAFGDPADPPVLLIAGLAASMLWWEEGFCRRLAGHGRFVIRYDHRDTGRSTAYPPGEPGYTNGDLVADAAGVLDAYGIAAAHVAGASAGGAFAQLLALDFPERVRSLTLISTSPAVAGGPELPPPAPAFGRFFAGAEVDRDDPESVIAYVVAYARMLAGGERPFDEAAATALVRRDVERARDFRAAGNHDAIPEDDRVRGPLSAIRAPTLVIHGSADPMFPPAHGAALVAAIPGARLLTLPQAGHGVERADWETIAQAIAEHTAPL
jgi:pimeloyl-ACP methyl ester carboxylesterase